MAGVLSLACVVHSASLFQQLGPLRVPNEQLLSVERLLSALCLSRGSHADANENQNGLEVGDWVRLDPGISVLQHTLV